VTGGHTVTWLPEYEGASGGGRDEISWRSVKMS
jgi:hypothetical protein